MTSLILVILDLISGPGASHDRHHYRVRRSGYNPGGTGSLIACHRTYGHER